eukprot:312040-Pyramimonas_sp.AAC.1
MRSAQGPRLDEEGRERFSNNTNGRDFVGHDTTLLSLGIMVTSFAWYGFTVGGHINPGEVSPHTTTPFQSLTALPLVGLDSIGLRTSNRYRWAPTVEGQRRPIRVLRRHRELLSVGNRFHNRSVQFASRTL